MVKFENRESVVLENEGEKIFGIFHRPLVPAPYPVVLICHGLGGHKTGKYRLYVHLAELLANQGIGCLRIDFRGSGDSEGLFSAMTIESEVSDALVALNYLKEDSSVDRLRMGVFGRSFGGVIGVTAASRFSSIKSMVLWAPVFSGDQWRDKWTMLQTSHLSDDDKKQLMRFNGMAPGYPFYKQLFSLNIENALSALNEQPILHIHGRLDDTVDLTHAAAYKKFRANAKGESKFIILDQCDHDFSHPVEQEVALDQTARWFKHTL